MEKGEFRVKIQKIERDFYLSEVQDSDNLHQYMSFKLCIKQNMIQVQVMRQGREETECYRVSE